MSKCPIDHSLADVKKKYSEQESFLPQDVVSFFEELFAKEQDQTILNEAFHFLKKYDLATEEERLERNRNFLSLKINK